MAETATRDQAVSYPIIGGSQAEVARLFRDVRWHRLDDYWRPWHRLVEECLRMVAGRHWEIWIDLLGQFVDIRELMTNDEREWRQTPVFNWIGYWYQITHAKLTENPPQVAFLPSSPDYRDSLMAELMDGIHKHLWDVTGMVDNHDILARWVCAAGRGWTYSYWDPDAGPSEPMVGEALMAQEDGSMRVVENAAYEMRDNELVPVEGGRPYSMPRGEIAVEILSPLEVRSSPEPVPEWKKRWVTRRGVMHVDEIQEKYGITIAPDVESGMGDELAQLLFGLGNMGAVQQTRRRTYTEDLSERSEGFAWVYESWERPRYDVEGMENGRHVIVVGSQGDKVALDESIQEGPDYWPLHAFDFVGVPARPTGKTPVEDMTPIQRAYNRGWAQILEHRALMTNPIWVLIGGAGIEEIPNAPGSVLHVPYAGPGVQPLQAVTPPNLSSDVWRTQELLLEALQDIGSLRSGSEGRPPTRDASGELVKELRFNDDRFIGPTAIRIANMYAKMVSDAWIPLLQYGWDDERMIRVEGDEARARHMLIGPEMFEGKVNVKPIPEALIPEGREERQRRIERWYAEGLFGPPGTPEAAATFFQVINYPHLNRAARPGGVDREMAEWENAELLRGITHLPEEAHEDVIHIDVHRQVEASPDFKRLPEEVQALFQMHRKAHEMQMQNKALKELAKGAAAADLIGGPEQESQPAQSSAGATQGQ